MTSADHIKTQYRHFAEHECRGYSELNFDLCTSVANDDDLVDFIAPMPVHQPNLFLAAIQFVTGRRDMPSTHQDLRSIVQDHAPAIAHLMQTRRTQTNEVGRCATILPALPRGPLALLEVGASAGLCLHLDAYYFEYGCEGDCDGGHTTVGDPSSPVQLKCQVTGSAPTPESIPEIAWRGGLDHSPLDVHDDDDVRWLHSCVWADHPDRHARLAAAIDVARERPIELRRGDLITDLAALLAEIPRDLTLVIMHSAVLVYVDETGRRTFADTLLEASRHRPIVWISNEAPTVIPEITELAPPLHRSRFLLGVTTLNNATRHNTLRALTHPHGAELEWQA